MSALDSKLRPNSTIARQHIQIEALVDALTSRFDAGKAATRNLVSLLNSLAAHLETHFELEEENDYFGYILTREPRLAERVDNLRKEHEVLRAGVDELVDLARYAFAKNSETTELVARFEKFREQLLKHEKAEVDLIQEAYTCDIGSGD